MDHRRAVEALLERAEQDPELAGLTADVREWVPLVGAIVAPNQEVRPGELPYDQLAHLLDRIADHWSEAKRLATA